MLWWLEWSPGLGKDNLMWEVDDNIKGTHTYVECCDRIPLIGNTIRHNDHGVMVRICADGYGCSQ